MVLNDSEGKLCTKIVLRIMKLRVGYENQWDRAMKCNGIDYSANNVV